MTKVSPLAFPLVMPGVAGHGRARSHERRHRSRRVEGRAEVLRLSLGLAVKTIGILGGMGPAATADFYSRLTVATAATRDQEHLHVIIDSCPQVPDRNAFLLGQGPDPTPMLIRMAAGLESLGAELLVMACNTASAFIPAVAASVSVPVVDWPAETAAATVRTVAGLTKIGILSTTGTARVGIFAKAFDQFGIEVIHPTEKSQLRVMQVIGRVKIQSHAAADLRTIDQIGRELAHAGANAVLLACTELSLLQRGKVSQWDCPTLDSSQLVAERTAYMAGAPRRVPVWPSGSSGG